MTLETDNQTVIRIEDLVREVTGIVSFPDIYLRLRERLEDPAATTREMGRLIAQDPALTFRVLRLANSPLYGLSRQVETVERAVTVLGKRQLIELVLATSASKVIDGIPNDIYEMTDFWRHSLLCGVVARELAKSCECADTDFAFVAGLLHDIGQLVLFNRYPGQSRVALEISMDRVEPMPLFMAERKVFGFDHAMLGGRLLEQWHLPDRLRESVEFHHEPARAESHPVEAALLHIANGVTSIEETELDLVDAVGGIDPVCWQVTGLEVGEVAPALQTAHESVEGIGDLFED
ncbi:MAG: HDOD domain-containing protein [Gammaproteobacteria bacterium]